MKFLVLNTQSAPTAETNTMKTTRHFVAATFTELTTSVQNCINSFNTR